MQVMVLSGHFMPRLLCHCRHRVLFDYIPTNEDEVELLAGDIIHVLEKCDDGWFVGTSDRTGDFGTFPGNYVVAI